ncbi:serine/arginine-rich splicing factor RSZ21A-like isoform X2 [Magnolia sinica]|uniref:serine/arginine-rich splicing factor RSZ21A-like isoform X2 n=1 Tax=Magnolia sinica TaxID=86752 RepID=UPI002659F0C3|nr:serine/arginine-rich splicing factor RSZ21A-like isoform X2 [Magnolia sinica]
MWKVYVGNLDSRITERELADEFRVYGVVRSVWVARNPPGYAFIEFDDRRDADDAISALDGKHGWRVEMSRNYGSGRSSRGRDSNEVRCYDCGGTGHFARECRSGGSRSSYRRSPSPHYRSGSRRRSPPRSERDYSRSPRRDRKGSYTNGSPDKDRWGYTD